jgi:hypothetical protein
VSLVAHGKENVKPLKIKSKGTKVTKPSVEESIQSFETTTNLFTNPEYFNQ